MFIGVNVKEDVPERWGGLFCRWDASCGIVSQAFACSPGERRRAWARWRLAGTRPDRRRPAQRVRHRARGQSAGPRAVQGTPSRRLLLPKTENDILKWLREPGWRKP